MKERYESNTTIIDLQQRNPLVWRIAMVETKRGQRGKGSARLLMQDVLADSDKEGTALILEIVPSRGPMKFKALEEWYARLGFQKAGINQYVRLSRKGEQKCKG